MPHTFPTPHPWRFSLPFPHDTQATETFFAKCQVSVVVVDEIIFWSLLHEGVRVSKYLPPKYMYIYNRNSHSKSNSVSYVMLPGA